jgi:hypothetical protein
MVPLGAAEERNFFALEGLDSALRSASWRAKSLPEEPATERLLRNQHIRCNEEGDNSVSYGVMGMLDRNREPKAGVAPPLVVVDAKPLPLLLAAVGVSSTNLRNCVLFMVATTRLPFDRIGVRLPV